MTAPSLQQVAARFGCSIAEVRRQYQRNAAELALMADKAACTGRKVNGYTEAELRAMAARALTQALA